MDVNSGEIYRGTSPTGTSLSRKDLNILRDILKKAGLLALGLELMDLLMANDLLAALGDIDPLSVIGGNLSSDDMLPLPNVPAVPSGQARGSKTKQ